MCFSVQHQAEYYVRMSVLAVVRRWKMQSEHHLIPTLEDHDHDHDHDPDPGWAVLYRLIRGVICAHLRSSPVAYELTAKSHAHSLARRGPR